MCGACDTVLEMDSPFEEATLMLVYRWVNAHVEHGYALPAQNVDYAVRQELGWMDLPPDPTEDGGTVGTVTDDT